MKVEVLCSINSGKYDKGDIAEDFTDEQIERLVKANAVRILKDKPEEQKENKQEDSQNVPTYDPSPLKAQNKKSKKRRGK